jgi:calcium-dependent protein kinase
LIDFGLAMRVDEKKDDYPSCGTRIYKSPEMNDPYYKRTPEVLKKADAFSFGVLLFTMLVGRFPSFSSKGLIKFPAESNLSPDAKDLIRKLTDKNHLQRCSVHDAMNHPWVLGETAPNIPLQNTVINGLKNYKFMSQFQKAVVNIVADRLMEEDKQSLKEAFEALDKNKDGKLDLVELTNIFREHKKQLNLESDKEIDQQAKDLYENLDHNDDGSVDIKEFMEVQVLGSLLGKDSEVQMDMESLFNVIDINGDGRVSVDEFAAFMAKMNPEDIEQIFGEADKNGNGEIDFAEFLQAMNGFVQSSESSRAKIHGAAEKIQRNFKSTLSDVREEFVEEFKQ